MCNSLKKLGAMFEDCIFKPIFQKFSTFISRLHIIKTTFRSPYIVKLKPVLSSKETQL